MSGMSDGGKGSGRRPGDITGDKWRSIFGESPLERKARLEREAKEAKEFDEKVVMKPEYYDQE